VLALVASHDLMKAKRIGVDGSTMDANAALNTIVRRDTGETYREMLTRMAKESGIDTPTADDLVRLNCKRKRQDAVGYGLGERDRSRCQGRPDEERLNPAGLQARAVDLDTGVVVAAPIHRANQGDTNTLEPTLDAAVQNLAIVGLAPTCEHPAISW
jgi:hypothetical protein